MTPVDGANETGAISYVDDTVISNMIQAVQLLEVAADNLRRAAKEASADPMELNICFSPLSDRQHSLATNIQLAKSCLVNTPNSETPHRPGPHASGVVGAAPDQTQYWAQPPGQQGAAPIQLPRLKALDMAVGAVDRLPHRPQAPNMAGTTPTQFWYMPQDPNLTLDVPIQRSCGSLTSGTTNAAPVTGNKGQGQLQSSNLRKPTQKLRGRPRSANYVNPAQDGNRTREKPHSSGLVSPAQITHQTQGEQPTSDSVNAVAIIDFASKQTPVRVRSCSPMTTEISNQQQGRLEFSAVQNAASAIDLTRKQTPKGPDLMKAALTSGNQAPNQESHHTHMASNARILEGDVISPQCMYDDPLDTEPNTPNPTSDAAQREYMPPDRIVGEDLALDSAVVGEIEEGALVVGAQLRDIPKAASTRRRKRAITEDITPTAPARRSARGK
ncbi:hypothetical protein BJY01DRAFT_254068 [Aspergillus pseudoustus]|uniref:Uncharacterized protein n=1 Tax=Aspergillus pseudoustus TaxID=1810923 RepID=A0ABR4IW03_9EURO